MVMDFSLLDKVKMFIESFDHTYSLWKGEAEELKHFIYKYNRRVAEFPLSPSAEGFALICLYVIDLILKNTRFENGEGNIEVSSVRVHETATGYAEAFREDLQEVHFSVRDIHFSPGITEQWKTADWWEKLINA